MVGMLDDKVVIVAGCGGIGDMLVRRYAEEGARVVAADLRGDHARRLAESIDPSGEVVVGVALDGSEESSVEAVVALTLARFGRVTGLHANFMYSIAGSDTIEDLAFEEFNQAMRVNAGGYLLCSRHVIPHMVEAGGGSILYTATSDTYLGAAAACGLRHEQDRHAHANASCSEALRTSRYSCKRGTTRLDAP